jgi:hypothetical protein
VTKAIPLHDIDDAEGFVRANIARSKLVLTRQEREELVAEGMVIICELAMKFQPRLDGYDRDGSFAGYASSLLGRKLSDAWHRMNPSHVLRTQPDGTRKWEYLQEHSSLDKLLDNADSDSYLEGHNDPLASARTLGDFIDIPRKEPA